MRKKIYGEYRKDPCPFCGKEVVTENSQGVPVCIGHKNDSLENMKCLCGEYLDLRKGKFGAFFTCMNCGNVSMKKALEINVVTGKQNSVKTKENKDVDKKQKVSQSSERKETVITSDMVDVYFS